MFEKQTRLDFFFTLPGRHSGSIGVSQTAFLLPASPILELIDNACLIVQVKYSANIHLFYVPILRSRRHLMPVTFLFCSYYLII